MKKKNLVEVQVYQSKNHKEASFARLSQDPKLMMEIVKCGAPVSLDKMICSVHRVQKVRTLNSPANGASFLPQSIVQSFFIGQLIKKQ